MVIRNLVRGIEWCGKHPFATGLCAILGVLGLIFSIYSENQSSSESKELRDTVNRVEAAVVSECSQPPCWSAKDIFRKNLYGATSDLIKSKLPPAFMRNQSVDFYILGSCRIGFLFNDGSVNYYTFSSDKKKCPFEWRNVFFIPSEFDENTTVKVGDIINPQNFPEGIPRVELAMGCVRCGSLGSPTLEFVIPGHFEVGSPYMADRYFQFGYSDPNLGVDLGNYKENYDKFKTLLVEAYPEKDPKNLAEYCGLDLSRIMLKAFSDSPVQRIGISRFGRKGFDAELCRDNAEVRGF